MTITMFDQLPYNLACGHTVVLCRLDKAETWTCEECGKVTDLRVDPYRKELEHDRDTADQIDKRARERGETVVRAFS
jgi:transcription elongation factor Elf1